MSVCWDGLLQTKVKEVDLYSALIVVAHTQGAQVRITQFHLQLHLTCLYLVSIHQMAPPKTEVADIIAAYYSFIYPERMKGTNKTHVHSVRITWHYIITPVCSMTANCSLLLIYLPLKDERYKQDTCTQCTYDMTLFHHTSLQHDSKLTYNVSSVTLNDCHIQHTQQWQVPFRQHQSYSESNSPPTHSPHANSNTKRSGLYKHLVYQGTVECPKKWRLWNVESRPAESFLLVNQCYI